MTALENSPAPAAYFMPATKPRILLSNSERQPCEIWTRVMGYHRPVSSFNIGKKGEHLERRFFREMRCTRA